VDWSVDWSVGWSVGWASSVFGLVNIGSGLAMQPDLGELTTRKIEPFRVKP
jgi:hypothetical protein